MNSYEIPLSLFRNEAYYSWDGVIVNLAFVVNHS
jgi:hypothetical protein